MLDLRLHSPFLTVYFFWHSKFFTIQCLSIAVEKKGEHGLHIVAAENAIIFRNIFPVIFLSLHSSVITKINNRFHPVLND